MASLDEIEDEEDDEELAGPRSSGSGGGTTQGKRGTTKKGTGHAPGKKPGAARQTQTSSVAKKKRLL